MSYEMRMLPLDAFVVGNDGKDYIKKDTFPGISSDLPIRPRAVNFAKLYHHFGYDISVILNGEEHKCLFIIAHRHIVSWRHEVVVCRSLGKIAVKRHRRNVTNFFNHEGDCSFENINQLYNGERDYIEF